MIRSASAKDISVSVVIPSYRPGEDIMRCLESVTGQQFSRPFEVIVVDSSPQDPTNRIRTRFPKVQVYHLKTRTLSGRARSYGASRAKGRVIFFTDTDCVVDPNWMNELWTGIEKGYDVVGGSIANGTRGNYIGTAEYLLEFNEMNPYARPGVVTALPSCNLAVQKKVFHEVGYFPDFMKGEDTIFCENVIASNRKIFFNPKAVITHSNRIRFVSFLKNQVALGEGAIEARRRTPRPGSFLVHWPVLIPFVPLYRTLIIAKRFIHSRPGYIWSYLFHFPLIFMGMIAHVWGFICGPYRAGLSTEKKA